MRSAQCLFSAGAEERVEGSTCLRRGSASPHRFAMPLRGSVRLVKVNAQVKYAVENESRTGR
jgi:hypothetical protein